LQHHIAGKAVDVGIPQGAVRSANNRVADKKKECNGGDKKDDKKGIFFTAQYIFYDKRKNTKPP
jgi:hypothetical protein